MKRRRKGLGLPPEKHRRVVSIMVGRARGAMREAAEAATKGQCNSAVSLAAIAMTDAAEAHAHAASVAVVHGFTEIEIRARQVLRDVIRRCGIVNRSGR